MTSQLSLMQANEADAAAVMPFSCSMRKQFTASNVSLHARSAASVGFNSWELNSCLLSGLLISCFMLFLLSMTGTIHNPVRFISRHWQNSVAGAVNLVPQTDLSFAVT